MPHLTPGRTHALGLVAVLVGFGLLGCAGTERGDRGASRLSRAFGSLPPGATEITVRYDIGADWVDVEGSFQASRLGALGWQDALQCATTVTAATGIVPRHHIGRPIPAELPAGRLWRIRRCASCTNSGGWTVAVTVDDGPTWVLAAHSVSQH